MISSRVTRRAQAKPPCGQVGNDGRPASREKRVTAELSWRSHPAGLPFRDDSAPIKMSEYQRSDDIMKAFGGFCLRLCKDVGKRTGTVQEGPSEEPRRAFRGCKNGLQRSSQRHLHFAKSAARRFGASRLKRRFPRTSLSRPGPGECPYWSFSGPSEGRGYAPSLLKSSRLISFLFSFTTFFKVSASLRSRLRSTSWLTVSSFFIISLA